MGEFVCSEDSDLHAIVRGSTSRLSDSGIKSVKSQSSTTYFSAEQENGQIFSFPESAELSVPTITMFNELEELYKPFYPVSSETTSISIPKLKASEQPQILEDSTPAKSIKSNKQSKRVMKQVKANSLSSDNWAWRKYGQKPIKGSPYPRSYYRCSSSEGLGCPARKQVERCRLDPTGFIITYTAEHNHPHPTNYRGSIAGSTRKIKYPTQPENEGYSFSSTDLVESVDDEIVQNDRLKKEDYHEPIISSNVTRDNEQQCLMHSFFCG